MTTVERLFDGPLDIVGDVHGQLDALRDLVGQLNYAPDGSHPDGRKLVFVGDLVDRGPDSPGVVERVMNMVNAGNAQCILGNHELNIVRDSRKLDNHWFFNECTSSENEQPTPSVQQKEIIRCFFKELPLALERDDLRIIHACWHCESIARLERRSDVSSDIGNEYRRFRSEADRDLKSSGVLERYRKEQELFGEYVRYGHNDPGDHWQQPRLLEGYAAVNEARQMGNPIAVLTSGQERAATKTYPAGGKFRFVDRVAWWNNYRDEQAVIIGHYWRLYNFEIVKRPRASGIDVFEGTKPDQWLGPRKNVYCVDFSVGGRGKDFSSDVCRLAAVRWPEATVMFDNGAEMATDYVDHS